MGSFNEFSINGNPLGHSRFYTPEGKPSSMGLAALHHKKINLLEEVYSPLLLYEEACTTRMLQSSYLSSEKWPSQQLWTKASLSTKKEKSRALGRRQLIF